MITLHRQYHGDHTVGTLRVAEPPLLFECRTMERPWLGNKRNVSCIPEGEYIMRLRSSPVVQHTSGGEFEEGWEVCDVPDRTYIVIHPGNWATDVEGCIAVGEHYGPIADRPAVSDSRDTFSDLMSVLSYRDEWTLRITSETG